MDTSDKGAQIFRESDERVIPYMIENRTEPVIWIARITGETTPNMLSSTITVSDTDTAITEMAFIISIL